MSQEPRGVLTSWKQIPAPGSPVDGKLHVNAARTRGSEVCLHLRVQPIGHPTGIDASAVIDTSQADQFAGVREADCTLELELSSDGVRITSAHVGDTTLSLE